MNYGFCNEMQECPRNTFKKDSYLYLLAGLKLQCNSKERHTHIFLWGWSYINPWVVFRAICFPHIHLWCSKPWFLLNNPSITIYCCCLTSTGSVKQQFIIFTMTYLHDDQWTSTNITQITILTHQLSWSGPSYCSLPWTAPAKNKTSVHGMKLFWRNLFRIQIDDFVTKYPGAIHACIRTPKELKKICSVPASKKVPELFACPESQYVRKV